MKKLLFILILSIVFCMFGSFSVLSSAEYDRDLYNDCFETLNKLDVFNEKALSKGMEDKVTYSEFARMIDGITEMDTVSQKYMGKDISKNKLYINYNDSAKTLVSLLGWNVNEQISDYYTVAQKVKLNTNVINFNDNFCMYDAVMLLYNSLTADMLEQTGYGDRNYFKETNMTLAEKYKDAYYFDARLVANQYSSLTEKINTRRKDIVVEDYKKGSIVINAPDTDTYSFLGARVEGFFIHDENTNENTLVSIKVSKKNKTLILDYRNKPSFNKSKYRIDYTDGKSAESIGLNFNTYLIYNGQCVESKIEDVLALIDNNEDNALSSLVFYDSDNNGEYDTLHINKYKNIVVEGKARDSFKIFNSDNVFLSYETENRNKTLLLMDDKGNPAIYDDIKKDDVLSIFEGLSEKRAVKVVISKNMKCGQIKNITIDDTDTVADVVIIDEDGNEQNTDMINMEFAYKALAKDIYAGEYYDLYFDYTGRISKAKISSYNTIHYGVFVKIAPVDDALNTDRYQILMMTDLENSESPRMEVLELNKNIRIDNMKLTADKVNSINYELFHTVVTYYTSSDKTVKKIISADSQAEGALYSKNRPKPLINAKDTPSIKTLILSKVPCAMFCITDQQAKAKEAFMDIPFGKYDTAGTSILPLNGTKIIGVPDISLSQASVAYADDFYKVIPFDSREYFHYTQTSVYKVTAYYDNETVTPRFIIYTLPADEKPISDNEMISCDKLLLVNDITHVMNPYYDTKCIKIDAMYGGKRIELYSKYDGIMDYTNDGIIFDDLSEGDIILPAFDTNGCITYAVRCYNYNPKEKDGVIEECVNSGEYTIFPAPTTLGERMKTYFFQTGYVYKEGLGNCGIFIADDMSAMDNDGKYGGIYGFGKPIKHIYTYDTKCNTPQNRIAAASMNSGISYYEDKSNISKAVIRHKSGNCLDVIIYK